MASVIYQSTKNPHRSVQRMNGFTLIELMVTMGVAIILAAVAIPQYNTTIQSQRTNAEITSLSNAMQFARSEAIKEGQTVSVCVSSDGATCTGTSWKQGWIIYSNPTSAAAYVAGTSVLLKTQAAFSSTDLITTGATTGVTVVNFNRDGFGVNLSATNTGLLFRVYTASTNNGATRCLWISATGNQYIQKAGATALTEQGTNKCV